MFFFSKIYQEKNIGSTSKVSTHVSWTSTKHTPVSLVRTLGVLRE